MKTLYKIVIIILSITLFCLLSVSIFHSRRLNKMVIESQNSIVNNGSEKYNFAVILHKNDDPYWNGIQSGIEGMAKDKNVDLEINYTNGEDEYDQTLRYMDMAILSNVEGIITHGYDTKEFSDMINKAVERGIPVITIDSDTPNSERSIFVGTNDFELGSIAGKQIIKALNEKGNIAIILNDSENKKSDNGSNIVAGVKDAIKNYKNIKIEVVEISDTGILGAKNVLWDIINNYKTVNVIICTSTNDTIGISQQLVDYNKVGDFVVIGYGNSSEILKYIEKGVIYCSLIPDPVMIGSKSIESLINIKENRRSSSYILTDINIADSNNIQSYIENTTREVEKSE